jgi:esterase/lipase superfamily enzyme
MGLPACFGSPIAKAVPYANGSSSSSSSSCEHALKGISAREDLFLVTGRNTSVGRYDKLTGDVLGQADKDYSFVTLKSSLAQVVGAQCFYKQLSKGSGPIVIFVHGCCVSLPETLRQAGDLKKAFTKECGACKLVVFDWATPMANYPVSLGRVSNMKPAFENFMVDLGRHKEIGSPLVLVTHSLGAYCLVSPQAKKPERVGRNYEMPVFQSCFFSRPDTSREQFFSSYPQFRDRACHFYLLKAWNDPNLCISSLLRLRPLGADSRRLGLACPGADIAQLDEKKLQVVDVSKLNLGHVIPYQAIARLYKQEREGLSAKGPDVNSLAD